MPDVAVRPVRVVGLCAGGAGLELGVNLALAGGTRPVAYVERDPFAASVLVARMADAILGDAPIWDDLVTFDGAAFRGCVDLVCAGFPCQPFSAAGQKLGLDDPRWLWPHVRRIIRDVGPSLVFLENVRGVLKDALPIILGDLADLGFDAEWSLLSAGEVGAPHKRERFWLLAYRRSEGRPEIASGAHGDEGPHEGRTSNEGDLSDGRGEDVAFTAGEQVGTSGLAWRSPFPPSPDDAGSWRRVLAADPSVEPTVHRMADGLAARMDRPHVIGNGVVPLVASVAFLSLARRAGVLSDRADSDGRGGIVTRRLGAFHSGDAS